MAKLADYINNLRKEIKPEPHPIPAEEAQKAEAYDYLTGRSESDE